ncbi:acyl-CoA dehydrogenase family protein [Paucibacter sp. XJ19-41]|uniref:acyl-CoA dehydrogenase family protein n=1 Tax=Paucibacter sp. XJ19-41 TaxID=2927824 RepID=UPI0023496FB5|nr:acyl-CoA dehydrogenase family protein [Paucibacter sp. XJ19-41]MDC6167145.1 acyl-CoA dehydrogenase family protein [Paucibacter sp. XJ19-41]
MIQLDIDRLGDFARAQQASLGCDFNALIAAIERHSPHTDRTGEIPDAFWDEVDVRGLNMMLVPRQFNPEGHLPSAVERVSLYEEVGRADPGYAIALPGPGLSMPPLSALGSQEQQARFFSIYRSDLPRWGAFAITEPHAGSDATALRTTARRCAGGYVLNGSKCFITNGARADQVVVFATLDTSRGRFGIRAFVVDRDTPGFEVVRTERMLGLRASQLAVLSFQDCEVGEDRLLWGPHVGRHLDAFSGAQGAWDFMRPMLTSVIVGTCRRIRDALAELLSEGGASRRLSGRDVETILLEMDRKIYGARLLGLKAAWKFDHGIPMSKDASMAKAYASRVAMELAEQALRIAGVQALRPGSRLERAYRDAKAFDILEGTGDMQRQMVSSMHRRDRADFAALINTTS